jgi:ABC-type multidrug transport system ATPase subunit
MSETKPAIEVRDLVKRFDAFTAVDGISFEVRHGEIFGFLGPNGAGKSTMIRMLTTLLTPTAGVARINGYDLHTQERAVRLSIGVIPPAMTSDLETEGFPNWLTALSIANPERYTVHALHELYLKGAGLATIWPDVLFLAGLSTFMLVLGTMMFKRTLE